MSSSSAFSASNLFSEAALSSNKVQEKESNNNNRLVESLLQILLKDTSSWSDEYWINLKLAGSILCRLVSAGKGAGLNGEQRDLFMVSNYMYTFLVKLRLRAFLFLSFFN